MEKKHHFHVYLSTIQASSKGPRAGTSKEARLYSQMVISISSGRHRSDRTLPPIVNGAQAPRPLRKWKARNSPSVSAKPFTKLKIKKKTLEA